ncbi:MAG TPA: DUF1499 domain-containing protein [Thermoanaerobaculia bacterium]|nr:DUF1499 domain-containing protein [Thermoanaerobaculia bacterium]
MSTTDPPPRRPASPRIPFSPLAATAAGLALGAALLAPLAALGSRWGWWSFRTGFDLLRWSAYAGLLVVVIAAVAIVRSRPGTRRRDLPLAAAGLILALLLVGTLFYWQRRARQAPPIHDITTDVDNPPSFVAIATRRAEAPNPLEYGGPEIAAQQRAAYPEIRPVILDLTPNRAFLRALDVAREMGWEIVVADPDSGRIEATDRTRWFGFQDDVVIRLTPLEGRTVVDVRSLSRVGRGDAGTNARRVRAFLAALRS